MNIETKHSVGDRVYLLSSNNEIIEAKVEVIRHFVNATTAEEKYNLICVKSSKTFDD